MTVPFGVLETTKTETPLAVQFLVYDENDVYKGAYDVIDNPVYDTGYWVFTSDIDFELAAPIEIDPDAPEPDPNEPEPEPEGGFEVNAGDKLYVRVITNRMSAADALLTDLQEAVELLPEPETVRSNDVTVTIPMGEGTDAIGSQTRDAEEGEPELTVEMTADPEAGYELGDAIIYTVTVTNTGAIRLGNIKLNHTLAGLEMIEGDDLTMLETGESATVTYLYEVTQADVNRGRIENTVTAIGEIDPVISNFADTYQYSDVFTGMSFKYPSDVKV